MSARGRTLGEGTFTLGSFAKGNFFLVTFLGPEVSTCIDQSRAALTLVYWISSSEYGNMVVDHLTPGHV